MDLNQEAGYEFQRRKPLEYMEIRSVLLDRPSEPTMTSSSLFAHVIT